MREEKKSIEKNMPINSSVRVSIFAFSFIELLQINSISSIEIVWCRSNVACGTLAFHHWNADIGMMEPRGGHHSLNVLNTLRC